jgi:hypothetical protein
MQNINYDLLKLLHLTLDNVWRLEKYYVNDAQAAQCHSLEFLKQMLEAEKQHAAQLQSEIKMRMDAGTFN